MHNHTVRARKAPAAIDWYAESNENKKDKSKGTKQEEVGIEEDGLESD
jgi:hypothetical protein